eukprot:COSAG01_NODE_45620_length_407_cov_9.071429_2_plen_68_part_01
MLPLVPFSPVPRSSTSYVESRAHLILSLIVGDAGADNDTTDDHHPPGPIATKPDRVSRVAEKRVSRAW